MLLLFLFCGLSWCGAQLLLALPLLLPWLSLLSVAVQRADAARRMNACTQWRLQGDELLWWTLRVVLHVGADSTEGSAWRSAVQQAPAAFAGGERRAGHKHTSETETSCSSS